MWLAALVFGLAGGLIGLFAVMGAAGEGWMVLAPIAGLAAAGCGALLWKGIIGTRERPPLWRGVLTGFLVGFIAHPVAWYGMILFNYSFGGLSSLGEEPLGPWDGLGGAFVFSFWSWLLFGWITILVGALLGSAMVWRVRSRSLN